MADYEVPKEWFEFMQRMWNPMSFPLPGMITPTVDIGEIEKKISELKTVENWLTMSVGFVQMTIKTLELQKAALESLHASTAAFGGADSKSENLKAPDLASTLTLCTAPRLAF